MTLVEFLLARISEDEAAARAGISGQADPENGWGIDGHALTPHVGIIHEPVQAAHIVRWHPARVLAECASKRKLIELHTPTDQTTTTRRLPTHSADEFDQCDNQVQDKYSKGPWCGGHSEEVPACPACKDSIDPTRVVTVWDAGEEIIAPCDVLRVLAAVYADHPDYQEDWRV